MNDSNSTKTALTLPQKVRYLMQLRPKARLDAILDDEKAGALVRAMPVQDLYVTILDLGLADSMELVQMASPEQFQAFVDLAAWSKDRIDPKEVLAWLNIAHGDEHEEFIKKIMGLDLEVFEYMLRALVRIHDLEEDPDVNPPGVTMESPEGKYLIEFLVDGPELAALRGVISEWIAKDPFQAGRLFEALRWELPTELEEAAYRFRSARLADLGFPDLEDAMSMYAYINPDSLVAPAKMPRATEAMTSTHERIDYVAAAFRGLVAQEQSNLEDEIRYLVNAVLVADGAEPGDPQSIRRISEMARDYLQLGLEHLCQGDPQKAAVIVQEHHLKKVFQVGFSLTLRLKFRVDRLAKEPLARVDGTWMLLPDVAPTIRALHRRRPLRALKVEGAEPVPFRNRRELDEASRLVDRATLQQKVMSHWLVDSMQELETRFGAKLNVILPERLMASVIASALLNESAQIQPAPAERLVELAERWLSMEDGKVSVRDSAIERATAVLAQSLPAEFHEEVRAMVKWTTQWVAEELGPVYQKEGRIEPKWITRLPIAGQALL